MLRQYGRADERSVIRRMSACDIHAADNGLRPHPPYASLMALTQRVETRQKICANLRIELMKSHHG
jgi:hypothetical protein